MNDARKLWLLNKVEQHAGSLSSWHAAVQKRIRENAIINNAVQNSKPVALVWSGMDCDCSRYSGVVHLYSIDLDSEHYYDSRSGEPFKTLREAIDYAIEDYYKWSDGPASYMVVSEEEAKNIEYQSRDLALEAFEDGHPFAIYAGM